MLFYKIEAVLKNSDLIPQIKNRDIYLAFSSGFKEKSADFYDKSGGDSYCFVSKAANGIMTLGLILRNTYSPEKCVLKYLRSADIAVTELHAEEITLKRLKLMLTYSLRADFIKDDDEVLELFGIDRLVAYHRSVSFGEALLDGNADREELIKVSDSILLSNTLTPELKRIYEMPVKNRMIGHPVHYFVKIDDFEKRKKLCRILLSALYANGRIKSRRFCFADFDSESNYPDEDYEALYKSCENGAVIVRYGDGEKKNGNFAHSGGSIIAALCETAVRYRNKVLTVFCLPASANKTAETFISHLGTLSLIEIYEDVVNIEKGTEYLKALAKENKIRPDRNLIPKAKDGQLFTAAELTSIFEDWYDKKLRTSVFPQYSSTNTVKSNIALSKPLGSAYSRLMEMPGLEAAKKTIDRALNFYKAQKLFKDKSVSFDRPSMHMVFTGNPGTAKTTVARLFAEIMKENGILSKGELYEVGRADIVGKYVGHTAPLVKSAFKRAQGSVLFIDEAYSLCDDKSGLYGDEAINTIVQEMENNRDDMIVIFAGYPDEMESFLQRNPGLSSRIAFHIDFEDYTVSELCDISRLIADSRGLSLSDGAIQKLNALFEAARIKPDFGNGRYVRNIIEKAQMAQAERLVENYSEQLTDKEICTLTAEDIEIPENLNTSKVLKIGFAS